MTAREMQRYVIEYVSSNMGLDDPGTISADMIFNTLNKFQYQLFIDNIYLNEGELIESDFRSKFAEEFSFRDGVLNADGQYYDYKMPNFRLTGIHTLVVQDNINSTVIFLESENSRLTDELKEGDKLFSNEGILFATVIGSFGTSINGNQTVSLSSKFNEIQLDSLDTSIIYVGYDSLKYKDAKIDTITSKCTYRNRPIRLISVVNSGHYIQDAYETTHVMSPLAFQPDDVTFRILFKGSYKLGEGKMTYTRKPLPISLVLTQDLLVDEILSQDCELDSIYHEKISNMAAQEIIQILRNKTTDNKLKN